MRALLAAVLVASALGACAATVPATCEELNQNPPPPLSCDQAIAAGRAQFATTPGITELTVQYGGICPPNARCLAATGNLATVFATLEDGSQLYVTVSIGQDGSVRSDAPQPVPPELGP
jgi:hypothetical protein